jgi:3-oxoadipate enol-lactonase
VPRIRVGRELELHYERFGAGPSLLFVSGTGGDLRVRPGVLDTPLAARFSVLAYDQRGLGRSDKPDGPYTMANYADDAAALLDAVGWERARVIGVSFGGMVAQELALRHPDRVERLVLCCTSAGGAGGSSFPLQELAGLPEGERALRQIELGDVRRDAAWRAAHPKEIERALALAAGARAVGAGEPRRREGELWQLEARSRHDTFDRLDRLAMPVLLCAGRHDGIAPLANMQAMARRIPGAELRVYDGGHLFLIQDRSAYPEIAEWLGG